MFRCVGGSNKYCRRSGRQAPDREVFNYSYSNRVLEPRGSSLLANISKTNNMLLRPVSYTTTAAVLPAARGDIRVTSRRHSGDLQDTFE